MKLSVNKRNRPVCELGTVLLFNVLVLILKLAFGPEKLPELSRNVPPAPDLPSAASVSYVV